MKKYLVANAKLLKEWNYLKNKDLDPSAISLGSSKKVWWICKHNHEWPATTYNRFKNSSGCPYCANQKAGYGNDLKTKHPEIAKQWHPTKNNPLSPAMVLPSSNKKYWWRCNEKHAFFKKPKEVRDHGCPYCNNRVVGYGNDLKTKHPEIAKQWHPTKNNSLSPAMVLPSSNKNIGGDVQ